MGHVEEGEWCRRNSQETGQSRWKELIDRKTKKPLSRGWGRLFLGNQATLTCFNETVSETWGISPRLEKNVSLPVPRFGLSAKNTQSSKIQKRLPNFLPCVPSYLRSIFLLLKQPSASQVYHDDCAAPLPIEDPLEGTKRGHVLILDRKGTKRGHVLILDRDNPKDVASWLLTHLAKASPPLKRKQASGLGQ